MRTAAALSCLLYLTFQLHLTHVAEGRLPHFGECAVTVDIQEVHTYFEAIKHHLHLTDTHTDVNLLDIRLLNGIQHAERCCFFRELLRFYLHNIFKPLEVNQVSIGSEIKKLANSFLGMKLQLKNCRENLKCLCGEQSKDTMDIIREQFDKLDFAKASVKAVSELNVLLHWMKNNIRNQEHQ